MPGQVGSVLREIDVAFNTGTVIGLTDRQLVERFAARRDASAEAAFAALVRRHGAMVLRVCRSILRNHHDAQDASQATFLILARKAGTLRVNNSLGPWLHGVAYRVSSASRASALRRRVHESNAARPESTLFYEEVPDDTGAILHEELARLPARHRAAIILCDLEGHTYEEAARELSLPVGTIKSRLARGRDRLRKRLMSRGIVSPAVVLTKAISVGSSQSEISTATIHSISQLASRLVTGNAAPEAVSSSVLVLAQGVLRTMLLSKLKLAAAVLLVACGVLTASVPHLGLIPSRAGPPVDPVTPLPVEHAEQPPQERAERRSTESSPPPLGNSVSKAAKPWETVVRIKIFHPGSVGFASGTVVKSTPGESLILSSAHQFKMDEKANQEKTSYRIQVDLFDGKLSPQPAHVHYLESVDGELVDCDFDSDVSLLRVRTARQLPASKVVPRRWEPRLRMMMYTVGCSEGRDATCWTTTITYPCVRGLSGKPEYEAIECRYAPLQGRTGGGLFTGDGYLAGICNFAEPRGDHGLYASPNSIHRLLDRNHLRTLYSEPVVAEQEINDLFRAAEGQISKSDWDGADHSIQHLDAIIKERRKGLQDELRAMDDYARRREQLLRQAAQRRSAPQDAPAARLKGSTPD